MRLTNTLTTLITEQSRFQVLYDKLVKPSDKPRKPGEKPKGVMDFGTLKSIIFADPTTKAPEGFDVENAKESDMEKVKVGKYTQWLLKNFIKPTFTDERSNLEVGSPEYKKEAQEYRRLFLEDLYKVTSDLQKYEKVKQYLPQEARDINKVTTDELFTMLDAFVMPEKKQKELEKKVAKKTREGFNHAGGEIVFEGPNWTMIRISDKGEVGKDAAVYYGGFHEYDMGETRWCTSSPGLTYFNGYIKDGPLYVVFPNDDKGEVGLKTGLPKERYQFHFPSNQYMDRADRQINLVEYLNGPMKELKEFFKPEFAKGLVKGGSRDVVDIAYPDNAAGKFIALYGFDELFDSLPDTIVRLLISNKSNENIALDVPESIGRFKNLEALKLDKICKTIPDSVCNLKLLNFLALPNNKELKSLPECLINLTDLAFINLKDSNPNVEIPPKLKERLTDVGMGFYYFE
jgi:hypothetical protein